MFVMSHKVHIVIIIILIIIILYCHDYSWFITGFWVADPEFAKDTGLDSMIIYFNGDSSYAHIDIKNKTVYSKAITIDTSASLYSRIPLGQSLLSYNFTSDENIYEMPKNMSMMLDIEAGTMLLSADGVTYARLIKDNMMSEEL